MLKWLILQPSTHLMISGVESMKGLRKTMCPQFSLATTDFIWLTSALVKRMVLNNQQYVNSRKHNWDFLYVLFGYMMFLFLVTSISVWLWFNQPRCFIFITLNALSRLLMTTRSYMYDTSIYTQLLSKRLRLHILPRKYMKNIMLVFWAIHLTIIIVMIVVIVFVNRDLYICI